MGGLRYAGTPRVQKEVTDRKFSCSDRYALGMPSRKTPQTQRRPGVTQGPAVSKAETREADSPRISLTTSLLLSLGVTWVELFIVLATLPVASQDKRRLCHGHDPERERGGTASPHAIVLNPLFSYILYFLFFSITETGKGLC